MFSGRKQTRSRRSRRAHLRIEELEARSLPAVYSPQQVWKAYDFNPLYNAGVNGAGQTIAIVAAYDNPTIAADLHQFNVQWGLPDAPFVKATPQGKPAYDAGWSLEIALDVQWAHAIAPAANILLVEAKSASVTDLMNAVKYAANQSVNGDPVTVVSMSWGAAEFSAQTGASFDGGFTHPGVTYVAASGDWGAPPMWPAISKNVVAVGGTTLNLSSTGTYLSETGWGNGSRSRIFGGSGGGISRFESKPSYQSGVTQSSTRRAGPDVAYDASPSTGFYVLDSTNGGWYVVGGTSAGAPQWAGLFALANDQRADNGLAPLSGASQTLPAIYNLPAGDFHDITSGNNGFSAGPGFDLVTGRGSPIASRVVPHLAATTFVVSAGFTGAVSGARPVAIPGSARPAGSVLGVPTTLSDIVAVREAAVSTRPAPARFVSPPLPGPAVAVTVSASSPAARTGASPAPSVGSLYCLGTSAEVTAFYPDDAGAGRNPAPASPPAQREEAPSPEAPDPSIFQQGFFRQSLYSIVPAAGDAPDAAGAIGPWAAFDVPWAAAATALFLAGYGEVSSFDANARKRRPVLA